MNFACKNSHLRYKSQVVEVKKTKWQQRKKHMYDIK